MKDSHTDFTGTNLSFDYCETLELPTNKKPPHEFFSEKLLDLFAIRLSHLEEAYSTKESCVTELMFGLHAITLIAGDMKTKYCIAKPTPLRKKQKEDDLNCTNLSTLSKRSTSSRVFKANLLNPKPQGKDKFAIVSPSVAINIGDPKKPDIRKMKSSESKTVNLLDSKESPKQKVAGKDGKIVRKDNEKVVSPYRLKKDKSQERMSPVQNKFHKIQIQNQKKIVSPGNNTTTEAKPKPTVMSKKNITIQIKNDNSKEGDRSKMSTNKTPISKNKVGYDSKKVVTPKKNVENKGNFKKMNSDYSNANTVASSENEAFLNSLLHKDSISNPNNLSVKPSYKLEPKDAKKSISIVQNISQYKSSYSSVALEYNNDKSIKMFSNKENLKIFEKVMHFSNNKERKVLKNINNNFRNIFFEEEINKLNKKIKELKVDLVENPFEKLEMPKILLHKISSSVLVLSNHCENLRQNSSFSQLVELLYQGIFLKPSTNIDIKEKINSIEKLEETKNIFFYFEKLFIKNIKTSMFMYERLSKIYEENKQSFCFQDLPSDFGPFVEFFFIVRKILSHGGSMMHVIDREILNNKLEILRAYFDSI
jgi:hypothetical protein